MTNQIDLQTIKDWFTLMVAIIATIAGVIFWVQSINDPKFEKIEKEIANPNYELLFVNDFSEDNTIKVIEEIKFLYCGAIDIKHTKKILGI